MKKQTPQRSCKPPERSCKAIKKHSCSEHTTKRSDTDERPKIGKNFCPCNPCSCDDCPDILQLLNTNISNKGIGNKSRGLDDLKFGFCPKLAGAKPAACSKTCTEVEPPKQIKLNMITYDDECTCELIARAIRADVHRYLSLVDRTPKPDPKSDCNDCPECVAKSIPKPNLKPDLDCPECVTKSIPKPNPKSDFKGCPECLEESIPNSKPRSKIKFSDSDIDPDLSCLQPDAEL